VGAADFTVVKAVSPEALAACRELFREYQGSLGVSLDFQEFDAELAGLPGAYAPPRGRLWLATDDGVPAGCVALRPLGAVDAEMKRLYVRPAFRGKDLGRQLAGLAIREARGLGYRTLRLDTLPSLHAALRLYAQLGFADTAPYYDNPIAGVRFLALDLAATP
jgi:GNAT superfamily N-acetyltransferase